MYYWYFAYGSNLCKEQMRKRVGEWKESKRAKLLGFRLTFDSRGRADIVEDPQGVVYGAVYLLTSEQLDRLDRYEGVEQGVYVRRRVHVVTEDGEEIEAVAYVRREKTPFREPDECYLKKILVGLREHGYGNEVVELVEKIARGSSG